MTENLTQPQEARESGSQERSERRSFPVSTRETECLQLASHGKTSAEIGAILGISKHTVDTHLKNATRKLDTAGRSHAIAQALRHGLIH